MSILNELYNGNIKPAEKCVKKDSEYQKCNTELTENTKKLTALLNDTEKELYEQVLENMFNLSYISEKQNFIDGFCIGSQMMLEILRHNRF